MSSSSLHRHSLHSLLGAASPTAPPIGSQLRLQPPPGFSEKLVTFSNHGELGIELGESSEPGSGHGVIVAALTAGGAAERCKRIKVGDTVRSINGLDCTDVPLARMAPVLKQQAIALVLWRRTAAGSGGAAVGVTGSPEDPWRHLAEARGSAGSLDMPPSAGGGAGRQGTWGVMKKAGAGAAGSAGGTGGAECGAMASPAGTGLPAGYSIASASKVDAGAAALAAAATASGHPKRPAFAARSKANMSTRQIIGGLQSRSLSVKVCSWNVGNRQPPKLLGSWLEPGGGEHDVVAVGLQEASFSTSKEQEVGMPWDSMSVDEAMRDMRARADERARGEEPLSDYPFVRQLQLHLGSGWQTAATTKLNEMHLAVFVRQKICARNAVGDLEVTDTATGLAGVYGNKGGLVAKLSIYGTTMCFVSCHLAAHEGAGYLARRHKDIRDIMSDSRVGERDLDLASQYGHTFFFGDLNYRVDMALDMSMKTAAVAGGRGSMALAKPKDQHARALEAVARGAEDPEGLPWLLARDELRWEHQNKKVLVGWNDCLNELLRLSDRRCRDAAGGSWVSSASRSFARIGAHSGEHEEEDFHRDTAALFYDEADDCHVLFKPTFKLKPGTGGAQYSEKRLPSWTDRVFWRSIPGLRTTLKLKHFQAHPDLCSSDHAPVSAAFMVGCPPLSRAMFDPSKSPEIWITNMRAERLVAMDFNGKSDPYVRFYSYPPGLLRVRSKHGNIKCGHKKRAYPQTVRKNMTLTPVWADAEVPNLLLAQTSKEHVLHQSLVLALYDWDRMSQDDLMGQVCIPFSDFATARCPVHITGDLTLHGECAGTIEFDVEMVWPSADGRPTNRTRPGYDGHMDGSDKRDSCSIS